MDEIRHDLFDANGTLLHVATAGSGAPLVLIHGFPETWIEWSSVLPVLAAHRLVIMPDYRGAGQSARPIGGYDKATMAEDIRAVVKRLVGDTPVDLVGHDMGAFVAFAYAAAHPEEVRRLVLVDAAVPGTRLWAESLQDPRLWHLGFHGKRDLAERLVSGREDIYIETFFADRAYLYDRATAHLDVYIDRYRASGAMRAAFEAYRTLPDDADANRVRIAAQRLPMPVLTIGGSHSSMGPRLAEMGPEIAEDHRDVVIERSGHWIAEEQPERFAEELLQFLDPVT